MILRKTDALVLFVYSCLVSQCQSFFVFTYGKVVRSGFEHRATLLLCDTNMALIQPMYVSGIGLFLYFWSSDSIQDGYKNVVPEFGFMRNE